MSDDEQKNEQDLASSSGYPERELYPNRKVNKHRELQREDYKQLAQKEKKPWIGILLGVIVIGLMVYNAYMDKKVREKAEADSSKISQTESLSDEDAAEMQYKVNSESVAYTELMTNPEKYEGKIEIGRAHV